MTTRAAWALAMNFGLPKLQYLDYTALFLMHVSPNLGLLSRSRSLDSEKAVLYSGLGSAAYFPFDPQSLALFFSALLLHQQWMPLACTPGPFTLWLELGSDNGRD